LLLALTSLSIGCAESGGEQFVVSDSAGIRVVMNLGTDRTMLATPVHLAFLQPPDSALTALPWGVVADPLTGRIFVADANGARVVLFDSSGRFVRTIGRSG